MNINIFYGIILLNIIILHESEYDLNQRVKKNVITYGSALKVKNFYNFFLHSGDIIFDRTSNEKVVSATTLDKTNGLLFQIKEKHNGKQLTYNQIVRCGDTIRLEHTEIRKNLHLSNKSGMISGKSRISSFGNKGQGNLNDNWKIECIDKNENNLLYLKDRFYLKNVNNNKYLFTSTNYIYNQHNCGYNCPILNNLEVTGIDYKNNYCIWSFEPGVVFDIEKEDLEEIKKNQNILDDGL